MIPEPEQGASRRTRSNFGITPMSFFPSMQVVTTFVSPRRWQFATRALHLGFVAVKPGQPGAAVRGPELIRGTSIIGPVKVHARESG